MTSMTGVVLKPNDRVIFGTGTVLLYRCQSRDAEVELTDDPTNPITYEFAIKEKRQFEEAEEESRKAEEKIRMEAENAAKMEALRREMQAEKDAQEAVRMAAQREMEEQMAKLKAEISAKQNDEDAKREA